MASTIGDHISLREYGHWQREKMAISEYESFDLSRNGTEPNERPIGTPCNMYRTTRSATLFMSLVDSCDADSCTGVVGVGGTNKGEATRLAGWAPSISCMSRPSSSFSKSVS